MGLDSVLFTQFSLLIPIHKLKNRFCREIMDKNRPSGQRIYIGVK